ncbi:hypothetical protein [Luteibacter yeojuensis]|uniref:Uncharacterized protein n=1 Tax=Luteibacter yeojuensis TaxID=345309 RepID=A0A7X5QRZ9_9GAMM|nr:hypothetical protein [Luteibacter yeojuensis]NID14331.1 hypothetical protein [Luteibacter yeojuensis]
MKNKMSDVRNHLVAMLEALGDPEATPEVVERAKATSIVAGTYINAVKCEIDALKLHDDIGRTTAAVELPGREEPRVLTSEIRRVA